MAPANPSNSLGSQLLEKGAPASAAKGDAPGAQGEDAEEEEDDAMSDADSAANGGDKKKKKKKSKGKKKRTH